jgi:hypothetical protein
VRKVKSLVNVSNLHAKTVPKAPTLPLVRSGLM